MQERKPRPSKSGLSAKVRARAHALGCTVEAIERHIHTRETVEIFPPEGHHFGPPDATSSLVCVDWADALERIEGATIEKGELDA